MQVKELKLSRIKKYSEFVFHEPEGRRTNWLIIVNTVDPQVRRMMQ